MANFIDGSFARFRRYVRGVRPLFGVRLLSRYVHELGPWQKYLALFHNRFIIK
jgi:hypothetical protein